MKRKIFLDFDETLFNHYTYLGWVDTFLQEYNVEEGTYEKRIGDFHTVKGENMRLYDHVGHIETVLGRSWGYISGELEHALEQNEKDFCYDDAHVFLEKIANNPHYDVRILTYGHGEYQRYKIKTCRVLSRLRIPIHVVNEPKKNFLSREFPDTEDGILVDDKHPLHLPQNWQHIWINRSDTKHSPQVIKTKTIRTLADLDL